MFNMKFIKFFSILFLLAMVALTSCNKEEINSTEVDPDPIVPIEKITNGLFKRANATVSELELGCATIDYPYDLLLLDSTTVTINSELDFFNAFADSTNYPIDFAYPLNVTLEDGSTLVVNNADELAVVFANCIPDTGWEEDDSIGFIFPAWDINFDNSCFQLVYPVTLVTPEGTSVTAANEAELVSYLSDGNFYSFTFPISLQDQDGNVLVAADGDELLDLLVSCNPDGGGNGGGACTFGGFACYQFEYPITLVNFDGSTVTANSNDEFTSAILSGNWVGFQYPITLIAPDSSEVVVNNDEELDAALLACGSMGGGGIDPNFVAGDFICYNFVFPIQITTNINGTITLDDQQAWIDLLNDGFVEIIGFTYPIGLVNAETGEARTVNSDLELGEAVEDCF
jgi:hypothetical protein